MGLRETVRRIRQEWADTPVPKSRPRPPKPANECTTIGCTNTKDKDGYCSGCWSAIFG